MTLAAGVVLFAGIALAPVRDGGGELIPLGEIEGAVQDVIALEIGEGEGTPIRLALRVGEDHLATECRVLVGTLAGGIASQDSFDPTPLRPVSFRSSGEGWLIGATSPGSSMGLSGAIYRVTRPGAPPTVFARAPTGYRDPDFFGTNILPLGDVRILVGAPSSILEHAPGEWFVYADERSMSEPIARLGRLIPRPKFGQGRPAIASDGSRIALVVREFGSDTTPYHALVLGRVGEPGRASSWRREGLVEIHFPSKSFGRTASVALTADGHSLAALASSLVDEPEATRGRSRAYRAALFTLESAEWRETASWSLRVTPYSYGLTVTDDRTVIVAGRTDTGPTVHFLRPDGSRTIELGEDAASLKMTASAGLVVVDGAVFVALYRTAVSESEPDRTSLAVWRVPIGD